MAVKSTRRDIMNHIARIPYTQAYFDECMKTYRTELELNALLEKYHQLKERYNVLEQRLDTLERLLEVSDV